MNYLALPIDQPKGNSEWLNTKLRAFPSSWHAKIMDGYLDTVQNKSLFDANVRIREAHEKVLLPGTGLLASSDRVIVKSYAEQVSKKLEKEFRDFARRVSTKHAVEYLINEVQKRGLEFPKQPDEDAELKSYIPGVARVIDPKWWERQIRSKQAKIIEQLARDFTFVHKQGQVYCSDLTVFNRRESLSRSRKYLEQMEAVSEQDEVVNLAECADSSNANPEIRRTELMVRMRGFEDVAQSCGHRGAFFTLTAPSKYHPVHRYGRRNDKYQGATVKDAQDYLCRVWQQVRAAWDREGIKPYGFRVVEPHHDGTPHWHLLLFFEPQVFHKASSIFKSYAIAEDREELGGNTKARFDLEIIDPKKGSATGYIAKYISKNIDGFQMDDDWESGKSAKEGAERVSAWASCWGIRQFQQIGGPQVSVWRELRKLAEEELKRQLSGKDEAEAEKLKAIHAEADVGNWAAFVFLMGGPNCRRCDQLLRNVYGREIQNQYGEHIERIIGVCLCEQPGAELESGQIAGGLLTRTKVWVVRKVLKLRGDESPPWSSGNNCTRAP